jgi:hypothetical protein
MWTERVGRRREEEQAATRKRRHGNTGLKHHHQDIWHGSRHTLFFKKKSQNKNNRAAVHGVCRRGRPGHQPSLSELLVSIALAQWWCSSFLWSLPALSHLCLSLKSRSLYLCPLSSNDCKVAGFWHQVLATAHDGRQWVRVCACPVARVPLSNSNTLTLTPADGRRSSRSPPRPVRRPTPGRRAALLDQPAAALKAGRPPPAHGVGSGKRHPLLHGQNHGKTTQQWFLRFRPVARRF